MKQPTLIKITGVIDNLQRWDGEENFIMGSGTKAVGGVAAISAAAGVTSATAGVTSAAAGLAGAAASAAINTSDTEDPVEFFTCTLGDKKIFGRFGIVSFRKGDDVTMAVEEHADYWEAYAVCRPKDRSIWMYPHCGRGIAAYWKMSVKLSLFASITMFVIMMALMSLFFLFDHSPDWSRYFRMWINFAPLSVSTLLTVFGVTALVFAKFGRLSSTIFKTLGMNKPDHVDLPQYLKTYIKNNTLSDSERRKYDFYSRWVYRY